MCMIGFLISLCASKPRMGSPGLLCVSLEECGFGAKSGISGASYALHLGAPNNIYFPDEPFCNLKCPRDINPTKKMREV